MEQPHADQDLTIEVGFDVRQLLFPDACFAEHPGFVVLLERIERVEQGDELRPLLVGAPRGEEFEVPLLGLAQPAHQFENRFLFAVTHCCQCVESRFVVLSGRPGPKTGPQPTHKIQTIPKNKKIE